MERKPGVRDWASRNTLPGCRPFRPGITGQQLRDQPQLDWKASEGIPGRRPIQRPILKIGVFELDKLHFSGLSARGFFRY